MKEAGIGSDWERGRQKVQRVKRFSFDWREKRRKNTDKKRVRERKQEEEKERRRK